MSPLVSRVSGGGAGRFFNKGFSIRRRIGKPRITFPSNGVSTDLAVAFTASAPEAVFVEHRDSDWQIATDSSFTNIINSTTSSTADKTTWQAGATYNGTLYARVKYKNTLDGVESEWSDPVSFNPTASISSSSTESITAGSAYSASVTANNSTSVSYTYAWKKDSTSIGSNSSSVNNTLYMYDAGKVFSCEISTPGCSTTYTLTRPSVSVASGVNATKNGGATVTAASSWSASLASVTGTPYPSSTVSYQWQFNGTNFSTGGTSSSVSFASFYSDSGKTVRCVVTHTDNSGSGQSTTTNFDYTMSVNRGAYGAYGGPVQVNAPYVGWNNWYVGSNIVYFNFTVPSNWAYLSSATMVCAVGSPDQPWRCTPQVGSNYGPEVTGNAGQVKNATGSWSSQLNPGQTLQARYSFYTNEGGYTSYGAYYSIYGTLKGYQNDTRSSNP